MAVSPERQANLDLLRDLAKVGVGIDTATLLTLMVEVLIDHLLPEGTPERALYDGKFEQALNQALTAALAEATKPKLEIPGQQGLSLVPG